MESFCDVNELRKKCEEILSSNPSWLNANDKAILLARLPGTLITTYGDLMRVPGSSSSLEKSLLIGDFLFVSKVNYGARFPMTTVAFPMVHDTIPVLKKKSYLFDDHKDSNSWKNKLQLPYMRLPGFEDISRNEIVVFNQPADTLLDMNNFHPDRNYYKPIDKKTNLVKRCVGIPGDSLEIRDGFVYINGEKNVLPDRAKLQFSYDVYFKGNVGTFQDAQRILKRYDITDNLGYDQEKQVIRLGNKVH